MVVVSVGIEAEIHAVKLPGRNKGRRMISIVTLGTLIEGS